MKADEEFAIEKVRCLYTRLSLCRNVTTAVQARLVKQAQQNIDVQFEKKRKGAEVAQKMYV